MLDSCKQERDGNSHTECIHDRHVWCRVTRKVFGTRQVDTVCADVHFGHRRAKGLQFAKRKVLSTEKDTNDIDDDVSNLLLTDESKMLQKLTDVGLHDFLYRNVQRIVDDGFDVAFCNDVKECEKPTGARP